MLQPAMFCPPRGDAEPVPILEGLVITLPVIPAKAGIQFHCELLKRLDSGFRRNDEKKRNLHRFFLATNRSRQPA
jgi:hypothetical protein